MKTDLYIFRLAAFLFLVVVLAALSVLAGKIWLSPADAWRALVDGSPDLGGVIVRELRAPRAVLAILVGGALGLSGAALQGLLRNPLAEPGVLGISTGASLGAVLSLYYGLSAAIPLALPIAGLAGAAATALLVVTLARGGGTIALILAGAALSSFGGALVALALNLAPSPWAATEIMVWLMGSLADRSWAHVGLAAPFVIVGAILLLPSGRALDALSLGEATAESLGANLARTRLLVVIGSALAVGAVTAVSGAIGFVGLIAGHLVRPLAGHVPSRTLPLAALAGAALVLAADIAVRLMPFGPEMKLGVVTALVGAPFFFLLILRAPQGAAMSVLSARNLTVAINGKTLIDRLDLEVGPGEMIAVLGPNGAGKSTLLGALAGLITPSAGAVTLDARPLRAWSGRDLATVRAYLPQDAVLEWPLTVERVVALGRAPTTGVWGEPREATARAIDAALASMDALDLKGRVATTLSGGELARVLLARAIIGDPRLLIADEPLAGLDPRHQIDALRRLQGLTECGRSVVVAMHDLDLAARFSSRTILLAHGRILADGPPQETLSAERIATAFDVEAHVGVDGNGPWVRLLR